MKSATHWYRHWNLHQYILFRITHVTLHHQTLIMKQYKQSAKNDKRASLRFIQYWAISWYFCRPFQRFVWGSRINSAFFNVMKSLLTPTHRFGLLYHTWNACEQQGRKTFNLTFQSKTVKYHFSCHHFGHIAVYCENKKVWEQNEQTTTTFICATKSETYTIILHPTSHLALKSTNEKSSNFRVKWKLMNFFVLIFTLIHRTFSMFVGLFFVVVVVWNGVQTIKM